MNIQKQNNTYFWIKRIVYLCILFILIISNLPLRAEDKAQKKSTPFIDQYKMDAIFEKLIDLERRNNSKINIVHIGDSHIQADLLTNQIRHSLQDYFGNGGYGFTFPYKLSGTNGSSIIEYKSNAKWQSRLNIYPINGNFNIGLSGIGFYTDFSDFFIEMIVKPEYAFNSLKIIYSTLNPQYNVAIDKETEQIDNNVTIDVSEKYFIHTINKGEYLSLLARKFKTSVQELKELNGIRGDMIKEGDYIRIPTMQESIKPKSKNLNQFVEGKAYPYYSEYISSKPIDNAKIYSKGDFVKHNIDGFVIENDKPGIVYHSIGVNGAKISDFNKYPLFFTQLNILHPDLVIISFGTNEAHNSLSVSSYVRNIQAMCQNIKENNPNTTIVIFTPPPSQFEKKGGKPMFNNNLIAQYTDAILMSDNLNASVWDFYNRMGGKEGIEENGKYVHLISSDKIHYTVNGYKVQGDMFTADFMNAFNDYKKRKGL